eukprot:1948975-Rhodomonas_salina.3
MAGTKTIALCSYRSSESDSGQETLQSRCRHQGCIISRMPTPDIVCEHARDSILWSGVLARVFLSPRNGEFGPLLPRATVSVAILAFVQFLVPRSNEVVTRKRPKREIAEFCH